jgi:uncharacterized membrane protein YeaQ/YmgE (transglycosylase-associated protein family)
MDNTMQLHDWILFLITGGLAGWTASMLVRGSGLGILGDVVVGVAGAFVGGYFAHRLQIAVNGYWVIFALSVLGATILLCLFRVLTPSRESSG